MKNSCPTDSPPDIAKIFFYKKTLYLFAIPNTFWFIISLAIIGYMTYTKYRLSKGVAPQHNIQVHIPSVSGRLNQDRIPPTARRLAWQEQSETSTSAIQSGVSRQRPSSNYQPITPSCVPPSVSTTIEKLKKYLNVNIHSFLVISMLLPPTVLIFCINIWNLKFEDWGHFVDNLMFTEMIFYSLYPYVVKKKLDKFC